MCILMFLARGAGNTYGKTLSGLLTSELMVEVLDSMMGKLIGLEDNPI